MAEDKTRTSQTLARGLQVLQCFQDKGSEYGIRELSNALHLPTTIVARLVTTLSEFGYLYQNPLTKKYGLGMTAYTLGLRAHPNAALSTMARTVMQRLSDETGETSSLNVVNQATMEGVCIASIESPASIKLTTLVGSVRPLHIGTTRKVLLAYLEPSSQERYLDRLALDGKQQIHLKMQLAAIRAAGYAYSEAELDDGAYAIASPVLDSSGRLLAGIAIAGPLYRLTPETKASHVQRLRQAAKEIESALYLA